MSNFKQAFIRNTNRLTHWGNKHLPQLLEVAGVIFFGLTIYKSVDQAPKVKPALEKAKEDKGEDLTTFERILTTGEVIIEPVFYGTMALVCFHGAIHLIDTRLATMMAAYGMKRSNLDDYILAAREVVGKNKEEKIESTALEKELDRVIEANPNFYDTKTGNDRIIFPEFNLKFIGEADYVRKVFLEASEELWNQGDGYISKREIKHSLQYRFGKDMVLITATDDNLGWKFDDVWKACRQPQPVRGGYRPAEFKIPLKEYSRILEDGHSWIIFGTSPTPIRDWGVEEYYFDEMDV